MALGAYRLAAATSVVEHDVTLGLLVTRRVLPGDDIRPLARTDDDAATREIAALAARLHSCQSGVADLPHLREIGTAFDRAEDPRIPQGLIADARRVFLELMADEVDPVVLHGDLQHLNVLNTGDGWRAIDPHGWIGDPAFESAALLANPRGLIEGADARGMDGSELARKARRRAEIYAEVTGYDTDRLRWWGFVGCVIAELWMIESHDLVHGAPLAVAEVLRAG
ncbi:MAG: aminoglycoside phosphotransferase family protein [Candidatus Nanopelagicales bacterium]